VLHIPKSSVWRETLAPGKLSDEGRMRLALAMKERWTTAKKAGKQRLA
jgi:hypothetical protein